MSNAQLHHVLLSNMRYAVKETLRVVEREILGEPDKPFYPNENEDSKILRNARSTISVYTSVTKEKHEKIQKEVKRRLMEKRIADLDRVLYEFNRFLFSIVDEAKADGIGMRKRYEEKKEEEAEKKNPRSQWKSVMRTVKERMEWKMQEMIQELNKNFESAQWEQEKAIKKAQKEQEEAEKAQKEAKKAKKLADYCRKEDEVDLNEEKVMESSELRLKNTIAQYKTKESELIQRIEEKDKEVNRLMNINVKWMQKNHFGKKGKTEEGLRKTLADSKLKKKVLEIGQKKMEEEDLLEKLADSEKEVDKLNKVVESLNKKLETMTKEMTEKQRETTNELEKIMIELKKAKDELKNINAV